MGWSKEFFSTLLGVTTEGCKAQTTQETAEATCMKKDKPDQEARYQRYLQAEREAVALYTVLAKAEKDSRRAQVFRELGRVGAEPRGLLGRKARSV